MASGAGEPAFYLSSAGEDEYETLARVYMASTRHQALGQLMFKATATPEDKVAMQFARIRKAMRAPGSGIIAARRRRQHSSQPGDADEILGYVLWRTVLNETTAELESLDASNDDNAVGFDAAALLNHGPIVAFLTEEAAHYDADMRGVKHLFLNHLYVRPDAAGQGVGTALVRACLAEAERLRLPAYVSASPAATPLYRAAGFVEKNHFDLDLSRWAPKHGGFGIYRETSLWKPAPPLV